MSSTYGVVAERCRFVEHRELSTRGINIPVPWLTLHCIVSAAECTILTMMPQTNEAFARHGGSDHSQQVTCCCGDIRHRRDEICEANHER
jgi:hypothetical protein